MACLQYTVSFLDYIPFYSPFALTDSSMGRSVPSSNTTLHCTIFLLLGSLWFLICDEVVWPLTLRALRRDKNLSILILRPSSFTHRVHGTRQIIDLSMGRGVIRPLSRYIPCCRNNAPLQSRPHVKTQRSWQRKITCRSRWSVRCCYILHSLLVGVPQDHGKIRTAAADRSTRPAPTSLLHTLICICPTISGDTPVHT